MSDIITIVLLITGSLVTLLAAVGMIRFPDIFTRMQAASKPSSLGLLLLAIAAAIQIGGAAATIKVVLVIAFVFLKVPVSAQALARAAEIAREPFYTGPDSPDVDRAAVRGESAPPPITRPLDGA
jgi:multicomponent Na+:H+ antiporter subunit G